MSGCWFLRGGGAAVSILVVPPLAASTLHPSAAAATGVPSLTMRVDSSRTTLGSPLELTLHLRYEQGNEPLVPDLTTLIEGAVVAPLAVSESRSSSTAQRSGRMLWGALFIVFAAQTAGVAQSAAVLRWGESAVSGGRL